MKYTAVADNLTLAVAYVKNWLKVDDATDDTLISDLIDIAKEMADDFLQNDFLDVYDELVGFGDDSTLTFQLDSFPVVDLSLDLWVLFDGEDFNKAAFKTEERGTQQDQSDDDASNDYSLNLTTGVITFPSSNTPDEGEMIYAKHYRLQSTATITIPGTIKMAVLKLITYLYELRSGGKKAETVAGLGANTWIIQGCRLM